MLASLLALTAQPALQVSGVFSDHMVLQRDRSVPIWGWAPPGERIWARGSWGEQASTKTAPDGRWFLRLRTGEAGGPYSVKVGGVGSEIEFADVLLGEVWLCGGQSNMEWPVGNIGYNPPIEGTDEEVQAANHPQIRLLQVPRQGSPVPFSNLPLNWTPCTPETVKSFSATGYLFGLNLYKSLNIPIGLISSNVGGTEVELWMKDSALRAVPGLNARVDRAEQIAKDYERGMARWRAMSTVGDLSASIDANTATDWTPIDAPKPYSQLGLGSFDGIVWYRAEFNLEKPQAAKLQIGQVDDDERTFVNGDLVGQTSGWSVNRVYDVPATMLKAGRNVVAVKSVDGMGEGGFSGSVTPIVSVGGQDITLTKWAYKVGPKISELPPMPPGPPAHSTLYNAMIAPLAPYAIRGAIWYQGESNVGRAAQYELSFPAMIRNWREDFLDPSMPFYFVQIAPFAPYGGGPAAAELRDAQRRTLRMANTGMVVTTDITPDANNIHPPKKREVGERLARWALARTYGNRNVVYSGPLFETASFDGARAKVKFRFAKGLYARGGDPTGFTVAGDDGVFRSAQAKIEGGEVVVWSDQVPHPRVVRYGWSSAPVLNLFNAADLPASPFRSDRWPLETSKASW